jgi:hypothetical protein
MTTTGMTPSRPGRNPRGRAGQSRNLVAALHTAGGELRRLALLAGATRGNRAACNDVLLEIAARAPMAERPRVALMMLAAGDELPEPLARALAPPPAAGSPSGLFGSC